MLTDDGSGVDPDKVAALCEAVVSEYGDSVKNPRRPGRVYAPLEGRTVKGSPKAPSEGMESAFSPDGWGDSDD